MQEHAAAISSQIIYFTILLLEFFSNWFNVLESIWLALEMFPIWKQAAVGELAVAQEAAL